MYLELLAAVASRLRDQTVYVRKLALKLLQQLVYVFSIFHGVRAGENEQFPDKERVIEEFEQAESKLKAFKAGYDRA